MANVRYWKVQLSHRLDDETEIVDVIGVVADSSDCAAQACIESLRGVTIIKIEDGGHVRFIRHTWRGPNTEVTVNGERVDAVQPH